MELKKIKGFYKFKKFYTKQAELANMGDDIIIKTDINKNIISKVKKIKKDGIFVGEHIYYDIIDNKPLKSNFFPFEKCELLNFMEFEIDESSLKIFIGDWVYVPKFTVNSNQLDLLYEDNKIIYQEFAQQYGETPILVTFYKNNLLKKFFEGDILIGELKIIKLK